jgi:hypothetical protein
VGNENGAIDLNLGAHVILVINGTFAEKFKVIKRNNEEKKEIVKPTYMTTTKSKEKMIVTTITLMLLIVLLTQLNISRLFHWFRI